MRKLYEIFKVLKVQKRIVSAETIRGNTVGSYHNLWLMKRKTLLIHEINSQ